MLAAFIIPFVIVASLFIMLSYFCEGKPDASLSLCMGVAFGFMVLMACRGM